MYRGYGAVPRAVKPAVKGRDPLAVTVSDSVKPAVATVGTEAIDRTVGGACLHPDVIHAIVALITLREPVGGAGTRDHAWLGLGITDRLGNIPGVGVVGQTRLVNVYRVYAFKEIFRDGKTLIGSSCGSERIEGDGIDRGRGGGTGTGYKAGRGKEGGETHGFPINKMNINGERP
ncbi:hypothetical protein PspLS_08272 [Pyricularia sp. CBS 133598]|nr:hypothetical protein PspLS_08272 [Pyricularia sp. CBS 133598]